MAKIIGPIIIAAVCFCLTPLFADPSFGQSAFKEYTDPGRRFSFEYPATMTVQTSNPDEVKIFHPGATLRITVFIQDRPKKSAPKAEAVTELFEKLKQEMKDSKVLEQGKLPGLDGAQGYTVFSYRDHRGLELVQLVQYYIAEDKILQMIVSDRTEGFKNLEKVIRKIHASLRILNPKLR